MSYVAHSVIYRIMLFEQEDKRATHIAQVETYFLKTLLCTYLEENAAA